MPVCASDYQQFSHQSVLEIGYCVVFLIGYFDVLSIGYYVVSLIGFCVKQRGVMDDLRQVRPYFMVKNEGTARSTCGRRYSNGNFLSNGAQRHHRQQGLYSQPTHRA
ncbi:hypothetical protein [Brenneria corticis]|uniref:hypothetical protein n=1 Tax=Brenneria corticis TaxID=2173106 RepID=UPI00143DBAA0|nr:hypothetical protein [Brenneria sp. CFCC 11842]